MCVTCVAPQLPTHTPALPCSNSLSTHPHTLPYTVYTQARLQSKSSELQGLSGREEELKERLNDLNAFVEVREMMMGRGMRWDEEGAWEG